MDFGGTIMKYAISRKKIVKFVHTKEICKDNAMYIQFPFWMRMFGQRSHETHQTGNYDRKGKIIRVTNVCVK